MHKEWGAAVLTSMMLMCFVTFFVNYWCFNNSECGRNLALRLLIIPGVLAPVAGFCECFIPDLINRRA